MLFLSGFISKLTDKAYDLLKNRTWNYFKIVTHLRNRNVLMGQLQKVLYISNDSMLNQIFLKSKIIFKKLEEKFLVKSAKTENIIF